MSNLTKALSLSAMLAGYALTLLGLVHLPWPQVLPWAGTNALFQYLAFMCVCAGLVVAGSFWSKRNPLLVGVVVAAALALLSGAFWPLLVTIWFAFASIILGKSILSGLRINVEENWLTNFLVGAGAYGTAVGLLAHFPVNYPGAYGVALALPVVLGWRNAVEYLQRFIAVSIKREDVSFANKWLDAVIAVVVLVYIVVALMPELGHDALAMHLFIPAHMVSRHQWGFSADTYVWAVMPMLGDWIFTVGYMLAGETAARLINISFILALGWLVRDLVLWAGGTVNGGRWAALIFLSTPLTFTEGSTLFIESVWTALVVAGTLAILRLCESSDKPKSWIALAALLLGFAVATKAVTLTILPVLMLLVIWHYKFLLKATKLSSWLIAAGLFLVVGLIPYLTAWLLTGNPVFPFFNGIFQSTYYPAVNFDSATIFGNGLTWDVLYRATFDSGKYLEATAGASGFQWLLLFVPASIALLMGRQGKGLTLLLVGALVVAVVFQSVSYFRYAFPAWAILAAAMGLALGVASTENKLIKVVWVGAAALTVLLNVLFLSAGAPYRDFPLLSIWDQAIRESYLHRRLPIRNAVEFVNQINVGKSPVAIFANPLTAGIKSDALYYNWYNFRFQSEINEADNVSDIANVLLRRGVDFVILDANWAKVLGKRDLIRKASEMIVEYGSVSVRKIRYGYRFNTELLMNPDFSSIDAWSLPPGAEYDATSKVITTNVVASVTQAIAASPGRTYLNSVVARCFKKSTMGRIQINWLDAKGQFIKAAIKTFNCTPEWAEQTMKVVAPPSANVAIVYVTGHTTTPLQFKRNSLRQ